MKKDINLLPAGQGHHKYPILVIIYTSLALGISMAILPIFLRASLLKEMEALDKNLGGKAMVGEAYRDLECYYDDLIRRKQLMEWVDSRRGSSDILLKVMDSAKSNNIEVEVMEISMVNGTITMRGITDAGISITDFLSRLKAIDDIVEVKVKEISLDKRDMKTSILLECKIATEGSDLHSLLDEGKYGDIDKTEFEEAEP